MALADLTTREAVLDAISEFDRLGREAFLSKYGFGTSRDHVVVHEGNRYDSKALVGAAHGYEHPGRGPLSWGEFSGGGPTIDKLRSLGFEIASPGGADDESAGHAVWIVRGGNEGQSEDEALREDIIAIGWHQLGDLSVFGTADEIATALAEADPERDESKIAAQKGQLFGFAKQIEIGDLVLLPLKTRPGVVAAGRVSGDYVFRPDAPNESRHVRTVEWLDTHVDRKRLGPLLPWIDRPPTVSRLPQQEAYDAILAMIKKGGPVMLPQVTLGRVMQSAMDELASSEASGETLRRLITRDGPQEIAELLGPNWTVKGRTGVGTDAHVPWIGVYPADSRGSAQSGYYAVYLFAADGSAVFLSLNQGTEQLRGGAKPLLKRALDLRAAAAVPAHLIREIDLKSSATRPRKYEAGNAAAVTYTTNALPSEDQLAADLKTFVVLVDRARTSGLEFDPEIEPLHLVIKWSSALEPRTVALHRAKAREQGSDVPIDVKG